MSMLLLRQAVPVARTPKGAVDVSIDEIARVQNPVNRKQSVEGPHYGCQAGELYPNIGTLLAQAGAIVHESAGTVQLRQRGPGGQSP